MRRYKTKDEQILALHQRNNQLLEYCKAQEKNFENSKSELERERGSVYQLGQELAKRNNSITFLSSENSRLKTIATETENRIKQELNRKDREISHLSHQNEEMKKRYTDQLKEAYSKNQGLEAYCRKNMKKLQALRSKHLEHENQSKRLMRNNAEAHRELEVYIGGFKSVLSDLKKMINTYEELAEEVKSHRPGQIIFSHDSEQESDLHYKYTKVMSDYLFRSSPGGVQGGYDFSKFQVCQYSPRMISQNPTQRFEVFLYFVCASGGRHADPTRTELFRDLKRRSNKTILIAVRNKEKFHIVEDSNTESEIMNNVSILNFLMMRGVVQENEHNRNVLGRIYSRLPEPPKEPVTWFEKYKRMNPSQYRKKTSVFQVKCFSATPRELMIDDDDEDVFKYTMERPREYSPSSNNNNNNSINRGITGSGGQSSFIPSHQQSSGGGGSHPNRNQRETKSEGNWKTGTSDFFRFLEGGNGVPASSTGSQKKIDLHQHPYSSVPHSHRPVERNRPYLSDPSRRRTGEDDNNKNNRMGRGNDDTRYEQLYGVKNSSFLGESVEGLGSGNYGKKKIPKTKKMNFSELDHNDL